MSYDDFKTEVRKIFEKENPCLSKTEIDRYFNTKNTDDEIRDAYKVFSGKNESHISPNSVAYCLTMLY